MAKRKSHKTSETASQARRPRRTQAAVRAVQSAESRRSTTEVEAGEGKFFGKMKEFYDNPAVRYIAGGLAATALAKFADRFMKRYPEITNLVRGSFDSIEQKLADFKESGQSQDRGISRSSDKDLNLQH